MNKIVPAMIAFYLWMVVAACSRNSSPTPPPTVTPPVVDSAFVQYGTPFNNVTDRQDAVIYQVNIRTFSQGGNFAGVMARLDSIKALGANVVYLMPIYPVGVLRGINSPYSIKDYTAVNPEFGTLSDLRALVDKAHSLNMSVILDWVANHTAWDHVWMTPHKDWYRQDAGGNVISPPGTGWNDVAQLNFNNAAMRQEMIRTMKSWVLKANVDGFRCDYADGPPADFWKQAIDTLRAINNRKLLLLAEGGRAANYGVGFDFNFGFGFFDNLKRIYGNGASVQSVDTLNASDYNGATGTQQIVRYTSNHDVNGAEGTPLELFGGKRGSMAAFVVAGFMRGVPMIYNGQEVATPIRLTFPFTSTKIDWSINPDVTAEYKRLLLFRSQNETVRRGSATSYSTADVCAFTKERNGDKVVVIANLRNNNVSYTVPSAMAGAWTDAVNGGSLVLSNTVQLQPWSYYILRR